MANIITSKTRRYKDLKPPIGSMLDWSHPLSKGLVGAWLMNEGGGKIARNIVNQEKSTTFTGGSWKPSSKGYVVKFDGSTNIQFNNYTRFLTNRNMSMISWGIFPNNPSGYEFFSGFRDVGYDVARFYFLHLAGSMNFECRLTTTGGTWDANINSVPSGIPNMLSLTYQPGKLISYLNANQRTLNTSASGYITAIGNNNHFNMGTQIDGANDSNASMIMSLLYNRALSPSEIKSLYESPYQFVAPLRKIRYITPGVGGVTPPATQDATVTPNAIVSRFFAPAVSVTATSGSESATVTATAIKASFVAPAVTAEATKNATIIATAIQVSVVAPSVSVSTGGNASVTVSAIKSTFVANSATVEATKNAVAVATAAAVRFLANSVTVSTTINTAVSVTSVSVKFVAGVATVQAIRNITIDATSAYARFLVNSATIVVGGVDSGITEVILLSSLVSKRLYEKSRISKRLNEVSRIDKTLLLDSPIH